MSLLGWILNESRRIYEFSETAAVIRAPGYGQSFDIHGWYVVETLSGQWNEQLIGECARGMCVGGGMNEQWFLVHNADFKVIWRQVV